MTLPQQARPKDGKGNLREINKEEEKQKQKQGSSIQLHF